MPSLETIRRLRVQATSEGVDKVTSDVRELAAAQQTVARTSDTVSRRQLSVASAYARLKASLDPATRAQQMFERGQRTLDRAMEQGIVETTEYGAVLDMLRQKQLAFSGAAMNTVAPMQATGAAAKLNQQQMANMSFQMNDMAVMLASGQNPFVMLMQQGMQITQIFAPGTGVGGALKSVGGAIISFVTNPLNLMVLGLASAAGGASLLFSTLGSGANDTEEILERHADLVREIQGAYKAAADGVEDYGRKSREVLSVQLMGSISDLRRELAAAARDLFEGGPFSGPELGTQLGFGAGFRVTGEFAAFAAPIQQLRQEMKAGIPDIRAFQEEVAALGRSSGMIEAAGRLIEITDAALKVESELGGAERMLANLGATASRSAARLGDFASALADLGNVAPVQLSDRDQIDKLFDEGMRSASTWGEAQALVAARQAALQRVANEENLALQKTATTAADQRAEAIKRVQDGLAFEAEQLRRSSVEQEVWNRLRQAGLDLSTPLGQAIAEDTRALMAQEAAMKSATEANQRYVDTLTDIAGKGFDAFDRVRQGSENAGEAVLGLVEDLIKAELRAQWLRLFNPNSAAGPLTTLLGGLTGSLFGGTAIAGPALSSTGGIGHAHAGAVIGSGGLSYRNVHPAYFDDAPRMHGGGLIGADERPIIAKVGEVVGWPAQMAQAFGGRMEVHIHPPPGYAATEKETRTADGGRRVDVMFAEMVAAQAENCGSPLHRALRVGHGTKPPLTRR